MIYLLVATFGFFTWACKEINSKKKLTAKLTSTFQSIDLKNKLGKVPNFINDHAVDEDTRRLTLTTESIPLEQFKKQKDGLEAGLRIYIDNFRQNLEAGTIDISYSLVSLPGYILESCGFEKNKIAA